MKQLYELHGQGMSIRRIAETLGISRNTVRTYLRASGVPRAKPRPKRGSKLDPHVPYLDQRLRDGVDNCVLLLRELKAQGYTGSYTILKDYVHPRRRPRQPRATVRFETAPGEQAQVDFGSFRYEAPDGATKHLWAFVMVLSWSRAIYLEFVPRADVPTFVRSHLQAFAAFGGMPRTCLYDNTKVVVLGRDAAGEPIWNPTFLDFSRRLGFEARLCRPYRAQTKGRVERGIAYVRTNFWPSARFTDLADLNRQAHAWCLEVANRRVHGTTGERPGDRLPRERPHLLALPAGERVQPFLREARKVGRDGFVRWERVSYGVPWQWVGQVVEIQGGETLVEIWAGGHRVAVHPRATQPGQRLALPGQWAGLAGGEDRPRQEPLARQVATVAVETRSLRVYAALAEEGR